MSFLNLISLIGIVGLCAIAWLFSENRDPKYFPWRTVIAGLAFQTVLSAMVLVIPGTQGIFRSIGSLFNVLFEATDAGARFIFGKNLVPLPGQEPFFLTPLAPGSSSCTLDSAGQIVPGFCAIGLGYIYAFRALPSVLFFAGLIALLYRLGVMQRIVSLVAKGFYSVMRLSGAEALSGLTNVLVSIEALIAVKPYMAKMTRSELCAVMSCCFGTAASSALPSYANALKSVFPNMMAHLTAASILAIPACFLLSKILVPEVRQPQTAWESPDDRELQHFTDPIFTETDVSEAEPEPKRISPIEAAIAGTMEGLRIIVAIVAVLMLTLAFVYLLYELFAWLATLPQPIGGWFKLLTLQNILGIVFLPLTVLTGISLDWGELWQSSVLVGRRLLETAVPPYQSLAAAAAVVEPARLIEDRAVLILSYALAGFANLAFWGIVVGGAIALVPSRRRDVIGLSGRALLAGTLATFMTASFIGFFEGMFGVDAARTMGQVDAPPPTPAPTPQSLLFPFTPLPAVQAAPVIIPITQPQIPNIPVV